MNDETGSSETQAQRDELERTLDESSQYQELADVQKEPLGDLDPNAETLEEHDEAFSQAEKEFPKTGDVLGG